MSEHKNGHFFDRFMLYTRVIRRIKHRIDAHFMRL